MIIQQGLHFRPVRRNEMATVPLVVQDSRYKTIISATFTGTMANAAQGEILDISDMTGWVSATLSKTNLAQVSWSCSTPIQLIWTGTTPKTALHLNGNGMYGGSNGMPAIPNTAAGGTDLGDLHMISAAASVGYVVCVFHKVTNAQGFGWTWTDAELGPPQNEFGG